MSDILKLITKRACPFAQRTRIVLNMLGLNPKIVEIDVYNKPGWFKTISPLGKVPVLVCNGIALFESTAINEYLVEQFGSGSHLIPEDPIRRAIMRAWVQFDETALAPAFYRLLLEQELDQQNKKRAVYEDRLKVLENHLCDQSAPFLIGYRATLADVTLYTHLSRLNILQLERGVAARSPDGPLGKWLNEMGSLASVIEAAPTNEELEFDLEPYLKATVQGTTAMDMAGQFLEPGN